MSERDDYADNDPPPPTWTAEAMIPVAAVGPWILVISALIGVLLLAERLHR
jgi:hypothetical protein